MGGTTPISSSTLHVKRSTPVPHAIVCLENAFEMQEVELEERAETIANLEQQLLEF
jgi:hypothetical protein